MDRKGVTPVIATSLLILIAISAVTTTAVFLQDTTDDIQDSVGDKLTEDEMKENSGISISHGFNNTDGEISIIVRNTGKYALAVEKDDNKNWNLYKDGRPQDFEYSSYSSPSNVLVDPGEQITIDTNVDYPNSNPRILELEGSYGVSASIICTSEGGSQSC